VEDADFLVRALLAWMMAGMENARAKEVSSWLVSARKVARAAILVDGCSMVVC